MRILPFGKLGYIFLLPLLVFGQQEDQGQAQPAPQKYSNKAQLERIHDIEKGKAGGISELTAFSKDPDRVVRIEAIKALTKIGGSSSLAPMIEATRDSDPEVRARATDGIVTHYLPDYVSGYFSHAAVRQVKAWFSSRNDAIIDEDVTVREDAAQAIIEEINAGDHMPSRANAALASGVLRLRAAVPALLQAIRAKDNDLIFESLVALQKIHDPSAGPSIGFLVRDLDERIQITALETVGVLGSRDAAPDIRYAVSNARNVKIRRAALSSLAMLAVPEDRGIFRQYVLNGDPELRAAALEGLGRIREPEDTPTLQTSYDEPNADWRIHQAAAFGLVSEGNVSTDEFSPLLYLVENLNSRARANTAEPYLKELMHRAEVRQSISKVLPEATRTQKVSLSWIFAGSHSMDLMPALTQLSSDADGEVSTAAKRAAHVIQQSRPAQ